jgi:hypothetical protein
MTPRKGASTPDHQRGRYKRDAKAVTDAANRNPATRCWRCGKTIAERRVIHPAAIWHAGHLVDGLPGGELRAECSWCNTSNGGALSGRPKHTSSSWPG